MICEEWPGPRVPGTFPLQDHPGRAGEEPSLAEARGSLRSLLGAASWPVVLFCFVFFSQKPSLQLSLTAREREGETTSHRG